MHLRLSKRKFANGTTEIVVGERCKTASSGKTCKPNGRTLFEGAASIGSSSASYARRRRNRFGDFLNGRLKNATFTNRLDAPYPVRVLTFVHVSGQVKYLKTRARNGALVNREKNNLFYYRQIVVILYNASTNTNARVLLSPLLLLYMYPSAK